MCFSRLTFLLLLLGKKSEQELKDEEMDLFTKYYSEWKGGRKNTNEFYKTIPRFYYRVSVLSKWLLLSL
jgi:serine/threonine-protein phosphatase 2A regulatory subunit B''